MNGDIGVAVSPVLVQSIFIITTEYEVVVVAVAVAVAGAVAVAVAVSVVVLYYRIVLVVSRLLIK